MTHHVTLLPGDGIGPEVTGAARHVLDAAGADLEWDVHSIGEDAFARAGNPLPPEAIASVRNAEATLKGPVTTRRSGYPSVNVSLRPALGLFAQVRPARALPPAAASGVDCVVIRATNEDLYSGVGFAAGSTDAEDVLALINAKGFHVDAGSALSVKACSREMATRVAEFAFDWARSNRRQRVTVVHKATNVRQTDGLFLETAMDVAVSYPDLTIDECLVDRAAELLVRRPGSFDVLLTQSMYGDILSDLCAGLIGGVGVAPGATFGDEVAIFEPVHGSAPKHAGFNRANPIAAILSGAMMLEHLGEPSAAARVRCAVTRVTEMGIATYDLADAMGVPPVPTSGFADAVVDALASTT